MWRLDTLIRDGVYPNWASIVDDVNYELYGDDEEKHKGESAYRKPVKNARDFYESGLFSSLDKDESDTKLDNLRKARIALRDERTAYNKLLTSQARVDQKLSYLEEQLQSIGKNHFPDLQNSNILADNDVLCMCTDFHIGQAFNNYFGRYDTDIATKRLCEYADNVINIQQVHHSENCFVTLQGDMISGSIHKAVAITNRENVIDQIKIVTELIANFLYKIAPYFNQVQVFSVVGNHSRIDRKDDAIHDERLDDLIPWALKYILSDVKSIIINDTNIDTGIAALDIRGHRYVAVHGDQDPFSKTGAANLSTFLGFVPYAILTGHLHTCALDNANGIRLIRGGSLGGSGDQYTIEKRLIDKPSQMTCVCNQDGLVACYPVTLH